MQISFQNALENVRRAAARYPHQSDKRYVDRIIFPEAQPKFKIKPTDSIFTIGSCFARNIEDKLRVAFDLPTLKFKAPSEEQPGRRPNGLLNEYNPGTMFQRISYSMARKPASGPEATIVKVGDTYLDLMLDVPTAVTFERAIQRRAEIDQVYSSLPRANVVIVTLGLVECWYDTQTNQFLNRMPPRGYDRTEPGRFVFRILDVSEAYPLLEKMVMAIAQGGGKILLTVSPVPLATTFSTHDVIVANSFSKAVLRVCAHRLAEKFPDTVDYFPSYEIALSTGLDNFGPDLIHVKDEVVGRITDYMITNYLEEQPVSSSR